MSLDRRSVRMGVGVAAGAVRAPMTNWRLAEATVGDGFVDGVAAVELARDLGRRARPLPADPNYTTPDHPGVERCDRATGRTVEE